VAIFAIIAAVTFAADQMLADLNGTTGAIDLTNVPACDAADHTVYFGDLAGVVCE